MLWRLKKRDRLLWARWMPRSARAAQVPQEDAGLLLGERQDQIRMGLDPVRALIPTKGLGST
jgi:hypothetical protein